MAYRTETSFVEDIDKAINTLTRIKNCEIENADIADHYDCREDLKNTINDLNKLLTDTEA